MKSRFQRILGVSMKMLAVCVLLFGASMRATAAGALEHGSADLSEYILQSGGFRDYTYEMQAEEDGRYTAEAPLYLAPGDEESVKAVILNALQQRQESIRIASYGIHKDAVYVIYTKVINEHPELFYVNTYLSWSYNPSSGNVTTLYPSYDETYTDEDVTLFNHTVAEIISGVDASWPAIEKILYLHDYLVTNAEYDTTYSRYNAYNALVEGSSVCQGYSLAFKCLMNQIGVGCDIVTSQELRHAWNLIELGGEYFYVDATWDDPLGCNDLYCGHTNFMVDRDGIIATGHDSTDWVCKISTADAYNSIPGSARYNDFFWKSVRTAIPLVGTKAGVLQGDKMRVYDLADGTYVDHKITKGKWYCWNSSSYYRDSYASAVACEGAFYYNTSTEIYCLELDGTNTLVYTLSDAEQEIGYLYAMQCVGRNIYYFLQTEPYGDFTGVALLRMITPVDEFVIRMYQQCLSREPDAAGLAGWAEQLESGRMNGAQVAEAFVFSDEMLSKNLSDEAFVKVLYRAMMGREADAAGLAGWLKELTNDYSTRSEVTKAFVESSEFTGICSAYGIVRGDFAASGDIERFVSRFYTICLGRPADQKGLWGWVGQLKNRQMNGAQIAEAFFFSAEFTDKNVSDEAYVDLLYRTILGREADAAGRSGWVEQLMSSRMTHRDMLGAFIVSDEFTRLCARYGIERGSL